MLVFACSIVFGKLSRRQCTTKPTVRRRSQYLKKCPAPRSSVRLNDSCSICMWLRPRLRRCPPQEGVRQQRLNCNKYKWSLLKLFVCFRGRRRQKKRALSNKPQDFQVYNRNIFRPISSPWGQRLRSSKLIEKSLNFFSG